ncbi:MAG: hypothetical protein AAF690_08760 [Acidobacteriota bacterium]
MKISLETTLACSFHDAAEALRRPALFLHIAAPLVSFRPTRGTSVPEFWVEGTYWFAMRAFGLLPIGEQAIVIEIPASDDPEVLRLRDRGHSRMLPVWDHRITLRRRDGELRYRDDIELDAGWLTPLVGLSVRIFFQHRQRRWRRLAASGFEALASCQRADD